jgi:hypothetical protein
VSWRHTSGFVGCRRPGFGAAPGVEKEEETLGRARVFSLSPHNPPPSLTHTHTHPPADAVLSTELGTGLTFTTVGPPHITGTARLEDGRPSVGMAVRGAWRAKVVSGEDQQQQQEKGASAEEAEVGGSYAIERIVDDGEFAGGIGPLSPVLTADDGREGGAGGGGSAAGHALAHLHARAPALAERVKAAVHAGLAAAASGA